MSMSLTKMPISKMTEILYSRNAGRLCDIVALVSGLGLKLESDSSFSAYWFDLGEFI